MTMPQKTPHDIVAQNKARVTQYVQERLLKECAARGSAATLARAIGFKEPTVANAKNYGRVGTTLAQALARHWGMTYEQMVEVAHGKTQAPPVAVAESNTPPDGEAPEATPKTPPAKSDVRSKQVADHWFPDDVEELYTRAIKRQATIDYSPPVGRTAKVFVRDATHQLRDGHTRLDLMITALEAARELEGQGVELTQEAMYGLLISKAMDNAKSKPPPKGETPLQRKLREAHEANEREGIEADVPAWVPRPPAHIPPEARRELPPPSSTEPAPPPASGPVPKNKKRGGR